ncbi:TRAP transporter large permease [Thalassovita aquimarina]|uniref:TRAP transporter large permease protein n=1 Tax=Thalassovita aquimarina TaxID=2785917 RepID=A0ABS5HP57_9RHOB|nr:TRAP transporter large permease [Thalassovita aquimarina]MBR9650368.1 TRAP transporter large permease [Thalassovita aquimarina]
MFEFLTSTFTDFQLGLLGFPVLLLLIALRVPLAAAMFIVGLVGTYLVAGNMRMMDSQLKTFTYGTLTNYSLSIIPLFLLMSEFATRGGMSAALFKAAEAWMGHRRGGLAMAAIGASAGFGAVCGSSLATASSMGRVALPELHRAGYSGALSTGALAAGGTLGILIPPSVVLVVYAILAEENIEKLFTAAFVPGILAMLGYMVTVAIYTRMVPGSGNALPRMPYRARFQALFQVWPVMVIFALVIGGIYTGAFSPTAAAAVGVAGTAIVAWSKRSLSIDVIKQALLNTAQTSAMIFFIILAAGVFNSFLSSAQLPQTLAAYFLETDVSPWLILIGMLLLYLILGTVMDSLAMIFLTVPIFIPIVTQLDFGIPQAEIGIWFGILVLMSAEIGLITPPVGMNLFVINAISKGVGIGQTYRGALPFVASDIIRIAILVAFPSITMVLVRLFYG